MRCANDGAGPAKKRTASPPHHTTLRLHTHIPRFAQAAPGSSLVPSRHWARARAAAVHACPLSAGQRARAGRPSWRPTAADRCCRRREIHAPRCIGTRLACAASPCITARTLVNPRPLPLPAPCDTSETRSGRASVWTAPASPPPGLLHVRVGRIALPAKRLRMLLPFAPFC